MRASTQPSRGQVNPYRPIQDVAEMAISDPSVLKAVQQSIAAGGDSGRIATLLMSDLRSDLPEGIRIEVKGETLFAVAPQFVQVLPREAVDLCIPLACVVRGVGDSAAAQFEVIEDLTISYFDSTNIAKILVSQEFGQAVHNPAREFGSLQRAVNEDVYATLDALGFVGDLGKDELRLFRSYSDGQFARACLREAFAGTATRLPGAAVKLYRACRDEFEKRGDHLKVLFKAKEGEDETIEPSQWKSAAAWVGLSFTRERGYEGAVDTAASVAAALDNLVKRFKAFHITDLRWITSFSLPLFQVWGTTPATDFVDGLLKHPSITPFAEAPKPKGTQLTALALLKVAVSTTQELSKAPIDRASMQRITEKALTLHKNLTNKTALPKDIQGEASRASGTQRWPTVCVTLLERIIAPPPAKGEVLDMSAPAIEARLDAAMIKVRDYVPPPPAAKRGFQKPAAPAPVVPSTSVPLETDS